MGNKIIRSKLLSEDGELTLMVLALDPSVAESNMLSDTVGEIRKSMSEDLASTGLKAELSGVPVMQLEIRNAVERDRLVYNVADSLPAVSSQFSSSVAFLSWSSRPVRR